MERTIRKVSLQAPRRVEIKRVAAYARVSTGKDAMLHSLSAQVSYYSNLIQKHPSWLYCGVYADEALTGTKDSRENFQRLLTACRNGEVDMVITKSISRFARNTVTLLATIRELKDLGVDVFFEEQNIHSMSGDGELMLTILASYAQEESRSASENQKWRVRKGFERGELVNWRFMYGYDISKDGIRVNEREAEIVREVFERFLAGESFGSISRYMEQEGVVRHFGGRWSEQRIRDMLSNEKYCGNALLMKKYRNNHIDKRLTLNRGELPMYFCEGSHDAIIDTDTFDRAQERLRELAEAASNRKPRQLSAFSGKIICAQCGGKYRRVTNHGIRSWNCAAYQARTKAACPGLQIREDVLYRAAADVLGLAEFDEQVFRASVTEIMADGNHVLTFRLKDGTETDITWQTPSRRSSWTPEMREKARQKALQQWRNQQ